MIYWSKDHKLNRPVTSKQAPVM